MHGQDPLSPLSPGRASTRDFRNSVTVDRIPVMKQDQRPKSYEPPQLHLWVVLPAASLMILLGVALEVALSISQKHQGFSVPEKNVFKFASQQFLTSFIPTLFVIPLALLWESKSWLIKRYQPYVNMSRRDTSVENSLLLDYVSTNSLYIVYESFLRKHWLVFVSSVAALSALALQPLAGSIFDVQQTPESNSATAFSIRALGLDPDRFQLTAFLAAAGYVLAAVSNNLPDPPFVHNNWATADFQFPSANYLNGTVSVNTTGIRTNATCTAPTNINVVQINTTTSAINSNSTAGCSASAPFQPANANQQYGVVGVNGCGTDNTGSGNQTFLPVFFWFYHMDTSTNQPQAAGVFCSPTLEVFNVAANASLQDGSLGNVTILSPITGDGNNVTGPPQNSTPFNGVLFDLNAVPDNFTLARAIATNNGVPGAILRAVVTNDTLLPNAFNSLDGFVDTASRYYTMHLALVAKNTYFLPTNQSLSATVISLKPRLVIDPLPAHALSIVLLLIGSTMFVVSVLHHRIRKSLFLASPPGSIASAVALTSHSGFGEYLVPYDTEESIATKMSTLMFYIDKRTGAIVATDRYAEPESDEGEMGERERSAEKGDVLRRDAPPRRGLSASTTGTASDGKDDATMMALLDNRDMTTPALRSSGYGVEPFLPPENR